MKDAYSYGHSHEQEVLDEGLKIARKILSENSPDNGQDKTTCKCGSSKCGGSCTRHD